MGYARFHVYKIVNYARFHFKEIRTPTPKYARNHYKILEQQALTSKETRLVRQLCPVSR